MKKSIFISGIASANLMMFGCLFKVFHWPGAAVVLCMAVFLFCLVFLPFSLLLNYREQEQKGRKTLYLVTFFVFFFSMTGTLFKIMHWPGAALFLLIGIPLPFVLFLPVYLYQTRKEKNKPTMNFLGIMFGLTFLAIFSVLLSLNVSKDILYKATQAMAMNESFASFNRSKAETSGAEDVVSRNSNELCAYIDNLKCELLSATQNDVCEGNSFKPGYHPMQLGMKENTDIPMHVLFAEGEYNKIGELKTKIDKYHKSLLASGKMSPELTELVNSLFDVSTIESGDPENPRAYTWENREFPAYQLILVMNSLSQIQGNVRLVEAELAQK